MGTDSSDIFDIIGSYLLGVATVSQHAPATCLD